MRNVGFKIGLASALLSLILSGCATTGACKGAPQPAPAAAHAAKPVVTLPPPTALETEAGIQIAHIAATAAGGLVDARFKVLDAAKATALLGNPANTPMLIAGDKPPLMAPHHALKAGRFAKDQIVFILYPNTRGAIQPGTEVIVALGQTRLGPVTAQ
jgi:hypothetical protein